MLKFIFLFFNGYSSEILLINCASNGLLVLLLFCYSFAFVLLLFWLIKRIATEYQGKSNYIIKLYMDQ